MEFDWDSCKNNKNFEGTSHCAMSAYDEEDEAGEMQTNHTCSNGDFWVLGI